MRNVILFALCVAFAVGVGTAQAADIGSTVLIKAADDSTSSTVADGGSVVTKWVSLQDVPWVSDGAGDADGAPVAFLAWTFTNTGADSASIGIEYLVGDASTSIVTTADAHTSGKLSFSLLDPGFMPEAVRFTYTESDGSSSSASTGVKFWLVKGFMQ